MNSVEKLAYALEDVVLDVAEAFIDSINSDKRRTKIDLHRISKNVNRNLNNQGICFFQVFVSKERTLELEIFNQGNEDDSNKTAECNNSGDNIPQGSES